MKLTCVFLFLSSLALAADPVGLIDVTKQPSFVSDDGSVIRNLPTIGGVESVHCTLPAKG